MIKLYWRDEDKRILVREMDCTWTWEDYYKSIEDTKTLLDSVNHPVIMLIDSLKVHRAIPPNALENISKANKNLPKNLLAQIIVTQSAWLEVIGAILRHLLPEEAHKYIVVRTMDRAEKQIARLSKAKSRANASK
jgi:hypothetical protein